MTIEVLIVGLGKIGLEYDLNNHYNSTNFNLFYKKNSKSSMFAILI
jgi:hypothetical protein